MANQDISTISGDRQMGFYFNGFHGIVAAGVKAQKVNAGGTMYRLSG